MKKISLIVSLFLAFSIPCLAQMAGQSGRPGTPGTPGGTDTPGVPGATTHPNDPSGTHDSQMHNDAQTSPSMKSAQKMGKKMTATGCISEKDGKYMLMSSQHPDGMELMTSEDLKPHVGHTVKVDGMMENSSMNGGSNTAEGSGSDAKKKGSMMNSGSNMSMMSMKMTSMKMVSESCTAKKDKTTK